MTMISINRNEEGKVVFDPPSVQILAQDLVVWVNNDLLSPHQPTPKGQPPTGAIPRGAAVGGAAQGVQAACGACEPAESGAAGGIDLGPARS